MKTYCTRPNCSQPINHFPQLGKLTAKPIQELYDSFNGEWHWRDHADQVSEKLANILDRMLLPTPKDRFHSAQGILKLLDEKTLLKEEEISETDISEAEEFSQPAVLRSLISLPKENVNSQTLGAETD